MCRSLRHGRGRRKNPKIAAFVLRGYWRPNRALTLRREDRHESTHHTFFDDNGDALFGGSICHGFTTGWARAEQSVAGNVETQSRRHVCFPFAKSTYPSGQAPRSSTYNFQVAGANLTNTVETVDAAGSSTKTINPHIYDGQVHPITGNPSVDTRMYARSDANTVISASMKGGKLVQVTTIVLSQDGRTITTTGRGVDARGQQVNSVAVYDKQ
jgi:hypothetical protein